MDTPNNRARQKLVKVYSATNSLDARMVQEVLANAGIESMLQGAVGVAVGGLYAATMGDWARQDILVVESAAAEASRILSELPERDQTVSGFEQ